MISRVVSALAALGVALLVSGATGGVHLLADGPASQTNFVDWYDVSE
jgi:hypothetical protein